MSVDKDMFDLFCKKLALCKVSPGERIGILSEDLIRRDYALAFAAAAEDLGADTLHVNISRSRSRATCMSSVAAPSSRTGRRAI
ncbi:MAG: hypothetical protein JO230_07620 [Xanthobacteraceae bacterium]|nr:hypothetical protein [Xanthobacteraceae bacterium]